MEEFRAKLFKIINESNLPADATYYIVKDVYNEINIEYGKFVAKARLEKQQLNMETNKPDIQEETK